MLPNSELVDVIDEGLDTKSNCVSDEMVDNAECVHKAYSGNLLKLTTNALDYMNMDMVLVSFLAILKLDKTSYTSWLVFFITILRMSLAKPKLSYVPTVFPTQSETYPNSSVPSSAYSCLKDPREREWSCLPSSGYRLRDSSSVTWARVVCLGYEASFGRFGDARKRLQV